jgi:hypothetical protein
MECSSGEVHDYPPRLVLGEQLRRRRPTGLLLEIEIAERLAVDILPAFPLGAVDVRGRLRL